jgi:hypothetical protein
MVREDMNQKSALLVFQSRSLPYYYQKYRELVRCQNDRIICDKAIEIQYQNPLLNIRNILDGVQSSVGYTLSFKDTPTREIVQMCMEGVASSIYRVRMIERIADSVSRYMGMKGGVT